MRKFTTIVENSKNVKSYKVSAKLDLIINANNKGESGYISDSLLSSMKEVYNYTILNIEETEEILVENLQNDTEELGEFSSEKTIEEQIKISWENQFSDKNPTKTEKMEWYHQMRKKGFDGIKIFKVIGDEF